MALKIEESFGYLYPHLAKQWHPTRNGEYTPYDFKPFSNKKFWWTCKDNPQHEWEAVVAKRSAGQGCCFCKGKATSKDNSLLVVNPELASEWHPTKNGSLKPEDIRPNSHKEIWWLCKKDSKHEWPAKVTDRHSKENGCPFCSGRDATDEDNLEVINPELSKEWHPVKNGELTPREVKPNSAKKVWWLCKKNSKHEWDARVYSRHRENVGCPYCANQIVCEDNCLATVNPMIAQEWHPVLNGSLTPWDVVAGTRLKVWWKCSANPDHEWDAWISDRQREHGCPLCSKHRPAKDYNLLVCNLELSKEWHPIKNGHLTPEKVTPNSGRMVWWLCSRNPTHEWSARVSKRNGKGQGCPFCNPQVSRLEVRVFCELVSVFSEVLHQETIDNLRCDILIGDINVVVELDGVFWHKNKIEKDMHKSQKLNELGFEVIRVREFGLDKLSDNDIIFTPKTESDEYELICLLLDKTLQSGENSDNHKRRINDYKGSGCLVNHEMYLGLLKNIACPLPGQSLEEKFPDVAKEWHYGKNGALTPFDMNYGASLKVWWKCSINSNHEWSTTINQRTQPNGTGCPYCRGKAVCEDNCLATINPELAKQWHPTRNGLMTPYHFTPKSNKKAWWSCPVNSNHEWYATIEKRNRGTGCPECWTLRRRKK